MTISNSNELRPRLVRRTDASSAVLADNDREPSTVAARSVVGLISATLVSCTLAFGGVHYWALGLLALGAAVIVLLWCLDAWFSKGLRYRASWLQMPLALITLLGLLQLLPLRSVIVGSEKIVTPLSFDPYATRLAVVLSITLLIYFAAALAFFAGRTRLRLLVTVIVWFGALIALYGLAQHFLSPLKIYGFREPYQALPFGPFINRNHFAAFVTMIVPLPLALLLEGAVRRDRILLYVFAVLLLIVAAIMTGSRGGLLTLVLVVNFLLAIRFITRPRSPLQTSGGPPASRIRRWLVPVAAAGGGLALIIVLVLSLGGSTPLQRIFGQSASEDATAGGRLHYWRATLSMVRQHPIVGVGLDAFANAFPQYDSLNGTYRVERAHNDYLQTLAETGLIGSFISLAFFVILFRQGFASIRSSRDRWRRAVSLGAVTGCFGTLVHSFFEFPLRTPANALLFLLLVVLATTGGDDRAGSAIEPRNRET
jgi:O-antigen ligase